jgi:hypothetical protein
VRGRLSAAGRWSTATGAASAVAAADLAPLHAKIGQLTLENDFLSSGPMKSQPAAYLTLGSCKKIITRSGDFSSRAMCLLAASHSLAFVQTGTRLPIAYQSSW